MVNASPRRCLLDFIQLPVQSAQLSVQKATSAPVVLDLRLAKISLEDLSCVAPSREVYNAVSLI